MLTSLFILPDCGLPTEIGDALDHVVLNLESLFVMKIEPRTTGGARIVPASLKKIQFFIKNLNSGVFPVLLLVYLQREAEQLFRYKPKSHAVDIFNFDVFVLAQVFAQAGNKNIEAAA